jgi:hypothetical protein
VLNNLYFCFFIPISSFRTFEEIGPDPLIVTIVTMLLHTYLY